jgi:hypothetical protein
LSRPAHGGHVGYPPAVSGEEIPEEPVDLPIVAGGESPGTAMRPGTTTPEEDRDPRP